MAAAPTICTMSTLDEHGGWPTLLATLLSGDDLPDATARTAVSAILADEATPAQIAGFLIALRAKGETADELAAMLGVVLEAASVVPLTDTERSTAIDIVGTGGDGLHSINVSTMAALVVAGAGVPVCKHGNRSASSKCGAADVLELLGVSVEQTPEAVARSVREIGMGFCYAPAFHPAFRFAGPPRRELGVPTAFNLLGPMANPGRIKRQLIGVADQRFAGAMIGALRRQGLTDAWVVHGDGFDEITTTGPTRVLALADGEIDEFEIDPGSFGLAPATPSDLAGGAPAENADAIRRVVAGDTGPHRDIVLINAAAALVIAGRATAISEGLDIAAAAIDDGSASDVLDRLVAASGGSAAS
jgi:anthranilate phosphoribosyltransferase